MGEVARSTSFPTRDFRRLWWGESISTLGSTVTLFALSTLVVLTLDGTAQDVGWLNAARWLPYLVLGLVVGALVDRCRRRPLLVATDLIRAVVLLAIPIAWVFDVLSLALVLVVVVVVGTASLVSDAAFMSLLPRLVPRQHLQQAHARIDTTSAVAQTAGPALGGLLVRLVGAPLAVLIDAASYVVSALTVLTIRTPEPPPVSSAVPDIVAEIRDGVRWIYRTSGLALLACATHLWFVAHAVLGAVIVPYALLTVGLDALQLGVATALAGLGSVVGAVCSSAAGRRLGLGGTIIAAHLSTAVGVAVMAMAGLGTASWAAAAVLGVGQLLHGVGLGLSNSHEMAYRQAITPDALQARTNITMRSFNRAVVVVAAPLGGLLAVSAGNRVALVCAATLFLAVALWLLASPLRTIRHPPSEHEG